MRIEHTGDRDFLYTSERRFAKHPIRFRAAIDSLGQAADKHGLEQFLTERYALYSAGHGGALFKGNIHHLPWPLERAEAEFEINELPPPMESPCPTPLRCCITAVNWSSTSGRSNRWRTHAQRSTRTLAFPNRCRRPSPNPCAL